MKKIKFAIIGIFIAALAACGGVPSGQDSQAGPDSSSSTDPQSEAVEKNLTETCEGYYVCEGPDIEEFGDRLVNVEGSCYLDDMLLNPDGSGDGGGYYNLDEGYYKVSLTWEGDSSSFEVCESYEPACVPVGDFCHKGTPGKETICYRCTFVEQEPEEEPEEEASCQGLASSCSWRSPGYCSSQRGCYLGTHFLPTGGSELVCKGTPHSCSSIYSEDSCNNQDGCDWK